MDAGFGQVSWPIERGLLVAREGRDQGFLQITVRRLRERPSADGSAVIAVAAEVANFYPLLRGSGWLARLGSRFYNATQLRAHVVVTHGFLRSLADLQLPESRIGTLREQISEDTPSQPDGSSLDPRA